MELKEAFGMAFRRMRLYKGLTQEDFQSVVTERYVRMLERGAASPTLSMVENLAKVLGVDPVVLLVLAQAERDDEADVEGVLERVMAEIRAIAAT